MCPCQPLRDIYICISLSRGLYFFLNRPKWITYVKVGLLTWSETIRPYLRFVLERSAFVCFFNKLYYCSLNATSCCFSWLSTHCKSLQIHVGSAIHIIDHTLEIWGSGSLSLQFSLHRRYLTIRCTPITLPCSFVMYKIMTSYHLYLIKFVHFSQPVQLDFVTCSLLFALDL